MSRHTAGWMMAALPGWATTAMACPFCVTETGQQVRAGIFNEYFWANLMVTLLPFPVLLAAVAVLYFGPPWPLRASASGNHDAAYGQPSSAASERSLGS